MSSKNTPGEDAPHAIGSWRALRQRAEAIVQRRSERLKENLDVVPGEAMQKMLHELRVHQIELEMQNEELRRTQLELAESRQRFFDLYDMAPVGYCTLSETGLILQANLKAASLFGVTVKMLVGQVLSRFILKEDQDNFHLLRKKLLASGEQQASDFRMLRNDGGAFSVHLDASLEQGGSDGRTLRLILSDATQRVQENARLLASLSKIQNLELALNEHAIVAITNKRGDITYVNDKFCHISQYTREELLGQNHRIINSGYHSKQFMRDLWRTLTHGQIWKGEIMNRAKDGSCYWVDTTIVPFSDSAGQVNEYFAIRRDITGRKNNEKILMHNAAQLRDLSAHHLRVKENERKRMAREIHDELGGMLNGIKSYLSVLIGRAQRENIPPDSVLVDASGMADQAIDTVRRLITELRPSVLDQLGIWAALESHAAQIAQRSNLICDCQIDAALENVALDADASTAAFRIVQELITNVIRHADASRIDIRATRTDGWIRIEVEDDGKGIESSHFVGGKSWGIIGMHERAQQCNGELVIKNARQGGTLAVLRLPLVYANEHE